MNQIQTSIAAVNQRQVTNKDTGQPVPVWDVIDASGVKYTAWEPPAAQQAMALVGQPVLLVFTEKQNGQYTNRTFKSAMPSAVQNFGAFAPLQNAPAGIQSLAVTSTGNGPSVQTMLPPVQHAAPSDRDAQIVRQSAYKAAVDLIGSFRYDLYSYDEDGRIRLTAVMADVRSVTEELVAFGLTGNWGGAATPPPAPVDGSVNESSAPWD